MAYDRDEEELRDLNAIMDVCGEMSLCGPPGLRNASLHLMALSVCGYPAGILRELAEDILCSHIADVNPGDSVISDLRDIRSLED
jgi:hypothetical protein